MVESSQTPVIRFCPTTSAGRVDITALTSLSPRHPASTASAPSADVSSKRALARDFWCRRLRAATHRALDPESATSRQGPGCARPAKQDGTTPSTTLGGREAPLKKATTSATAPELFTDHGLPTENVTRWRLIPKPCGDSTTSMPPWLGSDLNWTSCGLQERSFTDTRRSPSLSPPVSDDSCCLAIG